MDRQRLAFIVFHQQKRFTSFGCPTRFLLASLAKRRTAREDHNHRVAPSECILDYLAVPAVRPRSGALFLIIHPRLKANGLEFSPQPARNLSSSPAE
jgi:hypothetical protein